MHVSSLLAGAASLFFLYLCREYSPSLCCCFGVSGQCVAGIVCGFLWAVDLLMLLYLWAEPNEGLIKQIPALLSLSVTIPQYIH